MTDQSYVPNAADPEGQKFGLDRKSILADFCGTRCAGCGAVKRSRMSHCSRCYHSLPRAMQMALYKRFGEGYEGSVHSVR